MKSFLSMILLRLCVSRFCSNVNPYVAFSI